MNLAVHSGPIRRKVLTIAAVACLLAGCASTPKVDWAGRIGSYTYDEAVLELGPPDSSSTLTDGTRIGEWIEVSRGPRFSVGFALGTGSYQGGYGTSTGAGVSAPVGSRYRSRRLTFDPEGILQDVQVIR